MVLLTDDTSRARDPVLVFSGVPSGWLGGCGPPVWALVSDWVASL